MTSSERFQFIAINSHWSYPEWQAKFVMNQIQLAKNNHIEMPCAYLEIEGDRHSEKNVLAKIETARLLTSCDLAILLRGNPERDFEMRTTVVVALISLFQEMAASKNKPKLTLLVDGPFVGDNIIHMLVSTASRLRLLRNLETGAITQSIVEFVSSSKDLAYLGITLNPLSTDREESLLHSLIGGIRRSTSLNSLYVKSSEILSDEATADLSEAIRENRNIRHLSISHTFDDTKNWIFKSIKDHPSIRHLTLTYLSPMVPQSAEVLSGELSKILMSPGCKIRELEIRGEPWSRPKFPIHALVNLLGENTPVRVLRLNQTTMTTKDVDQLLCNLWRWPNLKVLDLRENPAICGWDYEGFFKQQACSKSDNPLSFCTNLEQIIFDKRLAQDRNDRMAPMHGQLRFLKACPYLYSFGTWDFSELWVAVSMYQREQTRRLRKGEDPSVVPNDVKEIVVLPSKLQYFADLNCYRPVLAKLGDGLPNRYFPNAVAFVTNDLLGLDPAKQAVVKRWADAIYQLLQGNPSIFDFRGNVV